MTSLINAGQTMTSLQIAEATGKQHKDVLRAIRCMEPSWEKITARKFAPRFKINELANGVKKETPYYELTKTECLYIATKFNDEARAKLIVRWEQLENERLQAASQPGRAEILPPPVENQQVTQNLVEIVDGKAVTTSRKLARVMGRRHSSILQTIKSNLCKPAFSSAGFRERTYAVGMSWGYEYLITRRGLNALVAVMRGGAVIAEAYKGAFTRVLEGREKEALPAHAVQQELPLQPVQPEVPMNELPVTEFTGRKKSYDEVVRELAAWVVELRAELDKAHSDLKAARTTMKDYAEMYAEEKQRRKDIEVRRGLLSDVYRDLRGRVEFGQGSLQERLEAHKQFKSRIIQAKLRPDK